MTSVKIELNRREDNFLTSKHLTKQNLTRSNHLTKQIKLDLRLTEVT